MNLREVLDKNGTTEPTMLKGFGLIFAAQMLRAVSTSLEVQGDLLTTGVERLPYHLSALGALILAGIAFVWGLVSMVRRA